MAKVVAAQALILGLSSEDAAAMVDDLEKKFHNLRNPSAFVASMVTKRRPKATEAGSEVVPATRAEADVLQNLVDMLKQDA
ncbi:hypothetical protein AK812_SmicGene20662 [Symbiodinium microadriaticum]|uniref:Uncharacterized protein n=1 Tax=Symbiodinium microadriaticum TaxID=2951 RepID=A0A1Q9DPH0_SYMMI|nr:hypothetical protein AK812_SmicGene20662 [Symbiodinium microadriaticum]